MSSVFQKIICYNNNNTLMYQNRSIPWHTYILCFLLISML